MKINTAKKTGKIVRGVIATLFLVCLLLVAFVGGGWLERETAQFIDSAVIRNGPVAAFGLSPEEGLVDLISEQVTYLSEAGRLTLEYRVKTDRAASFLLPFNGLGEVPEITVDGDAIDYTAEEHPSAYIDRPAHTSTDDDKLLRQSVHFFPNYIDHVRQPSDSYTLMLESLVTDRVQLALDDTFAVYDLSAERDEDSLLDFEVIGQTDQLRLVFTNGQDTVNEVKKEEDQTKVSFSLNLSQKNRSARKIWFAVPSEDVNALSVTVGGEVVAGTIMTLSEILLENPGVSAKEQEAFLNSFNRRLRYVMTDGSAMVVNSDTGIPFDRVSAGGRDMLKLCRFSIETPGEHTVTVTMTAVGSDKGKQIFCPSPDRLWRSMGSREMNAPIDGKSLFDFSCTTY